MADNGLVNIYCPGCRDLLVKTAGFTEAYCKKPKCRWEITVRRRLPVDRLHKAVLVSR